MGRVDFPADFIWGAATASYQIEGAYDEDGKGESIWDRFSHTPGNVLHGDTGDVACDHYHRYREDVELMRELGLDSYRFSISWPRIFPEGRGKLNQRGLDFYRRLIKALLEADIAPAATLYHWDLPQALQEEGGWASRDTARYFADYAAAVFSELGGMVGRWITHNEPWVVAFLGHATGDHAPGIEDHGTALKVAHNLLLSHGLAVEAYRDSGLEEEIGITLNLTPSYPATDSDADRRAARTHDGFNNRWFLDPVFRGSYPRDMYELYSERSGALDWPEEDLEVISRDIDFLGVNYYTRAVVEADDSGPLGFGQLRPEGSEYTEMGWEVYPDGLRSLLVRLARDYPGVPLYITENGAACDDRPEDGRVQDRDRIAYLRDHFTCARKAMEEGAPLRGYYVWSLMDNFEWAFGYTKRFGLIFIDYEAERRRILKDSALWYRDVIASGGVETG